MWSFYESWLISTVLVHNLSVSLILNHFKNITPYPSQPSPPPHPLPNPAPPAPPTSNTEAGTTNIIYEKSCDICNHITQQSKRLQMSFPQTDK